MDKATFFHQLDTLKNESDEEEDTNSIKDILPQSRCPPLNSSPVFSQIPTTRRSNSATLIRNKVPAIHRTTSAPLSSTSIVKETPPLQRHTSLLRHNVSPTLTPEQPSTSKPSTSSGSQSTERPQDRRTVSTPTIGSVFMDNSKGVKAMLKGQRNEPPKAKAAPKKAAKKPKSIKLPVLTEEEKVMKGLVFYWIPEDNFQPRRATLQAKAINHGAALVKNYVPNITHVVVDKGIPYADVEKRFKDVFSIGVPSNAIVVNGEWVNESCNEKFRFNHDQNKYKVPGSDASRSDSATKISDTSTPCNQPEVPSEIKKGGPRDKEPSTTPDPTTQVFSQASSLDLRNTEDLKDPTGSLEKPKDNHDVQYQSFGAKMDKMIALAKKMQYLPIDDDEDEYESVSSSPNDSFEDAEESGSEGERERERNKRFKMAKKGKTALNKERFSAMTGGTGVPLENNPNRRTIKVLEEMRDYYERLGDPWRQLAYKRACGVLRNEKTKISTAEQACKLSCIGSSIAAKIEEIVLTNRLRKLDIAKADPNDKILQDFMKIYGVGIVQANRWIQDGYKTLDDLKASGKLTKNQKIGIEHYDDFNTRIPRDEVTILGETVKAAAAKIDRHVEIIIGGSYRRGAATSGDIDCLITRKGTSSNDTILTRFLGKLVERLTNDSFLVAALAVPSNRKDSASMWHGACVLPGTSDPIWRRIDLLMVPETEFGAALIYFTGDDIFNRSLRLLASQQDMRLNQRGLYEDCMRGPKRKKVTEGTLLEGADEKKIFVLLGVPWREPDHRILH